MLHPKGKTPSRSGNLRKGVLFSAYGPSAIRQATCKCSRTLHSLRRTEQKKKYTPLGNTPLPVDSGGLGRKTIITYNSPKRYRKRCRLALSVSSQAPRQLPQRGSHWHVGQLSSGRAKHNISETVVLRCLGQRQLDKERCPEAAAPVSKARPFASCRASVVQWKVTRPAKASPFGRGGIAKQ